MGFIKANKKKTLFVLTVLFLFVCNILISWSFSYDLICVCLSNDCILIVIFIIEVLA